MNKILKCIKEDLKIECSPAMRVLGFLDNITLVLFLSTSFYLLLKGDIQNAAISFGLYTLWCISMTLVDIKRTLNFTAISTYEKDHDVAGESEG